MKSTLSYRTGIPNIDRTLSEIASDINELRDSVNAPQGSVGRGSIGKSGDLRLTVDDGYAYLEGKGERGWLTTFTGVMVDKPQRGRPFPYFPYLEVENLFAHQFTIRQLNAVNGDTIFSDTGQVESVTNTTVTFKDQTSFNICSFAVNDLIVARRLKADTSADIKYIKGTVTAVSGRTVTVTYTSAEKFAVGDVVARVGNTTDATRKDSVYIATNPTNTPYIDIYDNINSFDTSGSPTTAWTSATPKVRMGNLAGITDGDFGALTGHGIYAQNVFLKGKLQISSNADIIGLTTETATYTSGATFPVSPVTADWHFYTKTPPDAPYLTNTWYRYSGSAWVELGLQGTYIDGTGLYTGTVVATQVIAGTLTGFTIQTAASGQRVVIDPANVITFWNAFTQSATIGGGGSGFPLEILANGKMVIQTSAGATDNLYITAGGTIAFSAGAGFTGLPYLTSPVGDGDISSAATWNALVTFPGFGTTGTTACVGNDARLSDARTPTSHGNANHSATYIVAADAGVSNYRVSGVYVATSSGGSPTTQLYMVTDAISGFNFLVY